MTSFPSFEHHGLPLAEMSYFRHLNCYQRNKINHCIVSTAADSV